MEDPNYGWVVEMQIKATMKGSKVLEAPVSYRRRIGKSKISGTIRGVAGAGTKILFTILRATLGHLGPRKPAPQPYRVIQFTRFPEPGHAKTRLIPVLGTKGAAELHRRLAELTLEQVKLLAQDDLVSLEVRYTGGSREETRKWLGTSFPIRSQGDGNLGNRMARALHSAFQEGVERAILVGSDCPELSRIHMSQALELLARYDVVLGPAKDGGYYLIGLRRDAPKLFEDISWGTEKVLAQTLSRIETLGLSKALLGALDDLDRPEDLHLWEKTGAKLPDRQD
jgi:rSAM/selenodomain-associated transferase 1